MDIAKSFRRQNHRKLITFSLSDNQKTLFNLYMEARGKAVIWQKHGTNRVLDPKEIHVFEGKDKV